MDDSTIHSFNFSAFRRFDVTTFRRFDVISFRRLALVSLCLFLPACQSENGKSDFTLFNKDPQAVPPMDANVVGVRTFIGSVPWLKFGPEGDQKPDGVKLTLYLESGNKTKGVFGDGTIEVAMYRMKNLQTREPARELAKKWSFTPQQALPYLLRKATAFGWGYGLRLNWNDAVVRGHEIQLVTRFIRKDGAVITGNPITARVPEVVGAAEYRQPSR